jgi:hypothetical protein
MRAIAVPEICRTEINAARSGTTATFFRGGKNMAVATAVLTQSAYPRGYDSTQRRVKVIGTIAIPASPATYPKGGIPITFAPNASANGGIDLPGLTNSNAVHAEIYSRAGSGFVYFWTTFDLWTSLYKGNTVAAGQSLVDTNGNIQTCTTGGTAGSGNEPTWALPTAAVPNPTTVDNGVTWTLENPGTNLGLLQIFESAGSAAALAELSQGSTIPAGVSGDLISAFLEFARP